MNLSVGLQVSLASLSIMQTSQPLAVPVQVSIHNAAPSPVTVLRWGTPLDPRAGVLGVFGVCDTTNGQDLPMDTIKISRKLPASVEDLVEIPAQHTLNIVVNLPPLPLEPGHEYSVRAQGTWHAVWESPLADVNASQRQELGGAKRGAFQSNSVLVKME
ncbi:hypothetical protein NUU61_004656 [Penicillium alfredii]|uniref:Uncharacterized protein n=1 Tax=Penicillium alfredii TaxID=1506179 RepID=A0A9W9KDJ9_9EURO|nr:uncharacterized protein NUU61_004656 [Penicillium alfredii]KAJ5102434.1 hypothetical protein NUU61_004656 [Penicillium alfredii]